MNTINERVKPLTRKIPHGHLFHISWSPMAVAFQEALLWLFRKATATTVAGRRVARKEEKTLMDSFSDEQIYWAEKSCYQMYQVIGFYLTILRRWKKARNIITVRHHPRTHRFMDANEKAFRLNRKGERLKATWKKKLDGGK